MARTVGLKAQSPPPPPPPPLGAAITGLFPLWTLVAASGGLLCPISCAPLGTTAAFARGLALLMLSTGLLLTPRDLGCAMRSTKALALNTLCCFAMMPALALALGGALGAEPEVRAGLVLLGCVSGGQASNLLAGLAGGDLALSVVLTVASTLLGVFVTPALVKLLLGGAVAVDAAAVLRSTASMVLLPLLSGVVAGRAFPRVAARVAPACPSLGVLATLLLVTGGAANSSDALLRGGGGAAAWRLHAGAVLLPLLGGLAALGAGRACGLRERALRTITMESMVKSPTLAYVLALKHFGPGVAAAPAAAMVWLAVVGAAVATAWSRLVPVEEN